MTKLEKIEQEIATLGKDDLQKLAGWLAEYQAGLWDKQLEADANAGRLDKLIANARSEIAAAQSTPPVKHRSTASFWKLYGNLPVPIRKLADKNFELLKLDPFHPSLHFKNVSADLWSARVGMHYRALALAEK